MQATDQMVEDFKKYNPERAQALLEEGAVAERARWRGIEAVAKDLDPRHAPLVKAMKSDARCTGADLAMAVLAAMQGPKGNYSFDRLKVQRAANREWDEDQNIRLAFGTHNKSAFLQYRAAEADRRQPSKAATS